MGVIRFNKKGLRRIPKGKCDGATPLWTGDGTFPKGLIMVYIATIIWLLIGFLPVWALCRADRKKGFIYPRDFKVWELFAVTIFIVLGPIATVILFPVLKDVKLSELF